MPVWFGDEISIGVPRTLDGASTIPAPSSPPASLSLAGLPGGPAASKPASTTSSVYVMAALVQMTAAPSPRTASTRAYSGSSVV